MSETPVLEDLLSSFNTIYDSLAYQKMQITTTQQMVKDLEKKVRKEIKNLEKSKKKADKPKTPRAPSGFAKPVKISNELCLFLNKPEGSEIARTEVTKALISYIKEHNLQVSEEKSKDKIVPDEKLKTLLGIDESSDDLTFFNIQKYMNKHFTKHVAEA
jgi:chromatin remodeling complex protein RSC6